MFLKSTGIIALLLCGFIAIATTQDNCIEIPTTKEPAISDPANPNDFCNEQKESGSFKKPGDTECNGFLQCYYINGVWRGFEQVCPAGQCFHTNSGFLGCSFKEGKCSCADVI